MKRPRPLRLLRFALAGGGALVGLAAARPPNFLLIVSDDQRPDTLGVLGHPIVRTPHLDRLAGRGTLFTRAVAAYPICQVSRAELLTGCTAFRALPSYPTGAIDPSLATLAGTLRAAGYRTVYSGKWHNDGQPTQRGYGETRALYSSGGAPGPRPPAFDAQGRAVTGYTGWTFKDDADRPELEKGVGLTPRTDVHVADGARAFLQTAGSQPFFLHVNFTGPHDPRLWPPEPNRRPDPARIPLPAAFAPAHPFDHGNANGRDERLLPRPLRPADVRAELAVYYSVIEHLDAQVGRILATLDAAGLTESTVVVFTSDQGLALGSHGLLGKQNLYEHTLGVPLIVAGPGLGAGRRVAEPVLLRDLFPTFCELAGTAIPATVESRSFAALLRGESFASAPFVVGYFTDAQRAIREGEWKLIRYPKAGVTQLFHLATDPSEQHDLAASLDHRAVRDRLDAALTRWLRDHRDPHLTPQ